MTTLKSKLAGSAIAIALGVCLLVSSALADTVSHATTVGLEANDTGQECAISLAVGSDFIFGTTTWNPVSRTHDLAAGGVKKITLMVANTKSSRPCRVDVRGTALRLGDDGVPIHDLKLEEGSGSTINVETVPQVPDQEMPEIPAWLVDAASDGDCAIVRATLSTAHLTKSPRGAYTGLVTLTASANAP